MRRAALLAAIAALTAPVAFAHGGKGPIVPRDLWHHWIFDPAIWAPLLLAHWLYGRGVLRAWARAGTGRVIPAWRAACFVAGEFVLAVALISPLDPLGETLLTAHMVQHILLTAVAPPLLVLGLPLRAWTWALPRAWRRIGATQPAKGLVSFVNTLSRPVTAACLSGVVLWAWHAPQLFEAALNYPLIHTLEHATFLISSLLVWRAVLSRETRPVVAAGLVLIAFFVGGMLGGLISLAPVQLYDWYGSYAWLWGLAPIEDQQLAGLAMWIPAGGIYLVAFAVLAFRAADAPGSGRWPRIGIIRASTSSRSMK
jgi:putative membrane protein